MLNEMMSLLRGHDLCVLATCAGDTPRCSLMTYLADPDEPTVYLVTSRSTRKYRNILENPNVSLLIDTRAATESTHRGHIQALTVQGICGPVNDPEQERNILQWFKARHDHLNPLLSGKDRELLRVRIQSFLLLTGATNARFLSLA